ncbi:MAG: GLPGLI family protein, partial [Bacteroidetes bacterium]|nr:GLPGLI family protein [Bacteroidota bacterium]
SVLLLSIVFSFGNELVAQLSYGKIVYERKTNLYKKFKEDDVKDWLKEEDKNKVDVFELYFNDSLSLFKPQDNDLKEKMSWATSKNIVYQNFKENSSLSIKSVWGEELYVLDTVKKREWKITDSKRMISGYNCRKAIWKMNDSTRIYAWYTDDIVPSVGPESFCGLPGAILGIATEDGGVIYFAKSIEVSKPETETLLFKKGKKKIYSPAELRGKLEKDFGKNPWGKIMIRELFSW